MADPKEKLIEWDRRLVKVARRIRVLSTLSWPESVERAFMEGVERGEPALPEPPPVEYRYGEEEAALRDLLQEIDGGHPLGAFLARTAQSYLDAAEMLDAAGSDDFRVRSLALYGGPRDPIVAGAPTHLEAARFYLEGTEGCDPNPPPDTMAAEPAAAMLQSWVDRYFTDEPLPVQVRDGLSALASAGSSRVSLRAGAQFSELKLEQLLHHEALVHAATKRNGQAQPILTAMGLSSPRTTAAQEGLATLAEMITDTMDLRRLRRIALRICAVDAALEGADFIEVFQLFRDGGQPPEESYHSAARVFRGGRTSGGVAFTKDIVYIKGLLLTHTFLLKAIRDGRRALPARLFAGRMTLGDAIALEPFFDSGELIPPQVVPPWIANEACLAAYLSWAAFNTRIQLGGVALADFAGA